ncbi:MAG: hypothetical protein KAS49_06100, partial [Candidatus Cloacimonetes bacterium]|nr:hypothetical protein [Candidatus Cloacimonadota bacterium]
FGLTSRYIKRYVLNGKFEAILQKKIHGISTSYEWNISSSHHQEFADDAKFDSNLHFVSSRRVWENSEDLDEREKEQITSFISYKRPLWGRTLTITGEYVDNLVEKNKTITLPSISYSLQSKPIYELFFNENDDIPANAWWKDFSYSYNVKAVHVGSINDPDADLADIFYENEQDSLGAYINQHNAGIEHSVGLRYSHKYRGWLDLSQSADLSEAWFDRDKNYQLTQDYFVRGSDYGFNSAIGFSLYGLGDLPGNYIRAVRHVASPQVTFTFKPDFTQNEKFYSFSGVGLASTDKQRKITFAFTNKWDLKLSKKVDLPEGEASEAEKVNDFFKLKSSINYNFENKPEGYS